VSFDDPVATENAIKAVDGMQMGRKRLKVAHKKEKGTYDAPSRGGGDLGGAGPAGDMGARPDGGLAM
jgi:hypothetical protein